MTRGWRTFAMGSAVLLVSACATSVAGTAEVGPGVVAPNSVASSGLGSVPSSFPDPTDLPQSIPVPSSVPLSSDESSGSASSTDGSVPAGTTSRSATASTVTASTVTASTTTASTTTKSTPATSKPVSQPTKLSCKSGAVTAKGGVFCYEIPKGFNDTSKSATYPGTDPVRTAVQPPEGGRRDLIFVTSTTLTVDSDNLSDALIKASLKKALGAGSNGATTSELVQIKVAGDRAFETNLKFSDGVMQRYVLIFAAKTRVSVSCQYQDAKAQIAAACKTVLSTLQIKNP